MKRALALALCPALVQAATYAPGIYTGTASGHEEGITVTVTVDEEAITEVSDATVNMTRERLSDTTAKVTITVTAEDSVTVRVYSVMLTAPTEPAPVGIAETEDVPTFKVYPNPAQSILNIVAEGEVTITDMRGSVMTTHQCHGTTQIDISNLPQGAYIIRTTSGSQRFIKKN